MCVICDLINYENTGIYTCTNTKNKINLDDIIVISGNGKLYVSFSSRIKKLRCNCTKIREIPEHMVPINLEILDVSSSCITKLPKFLPQTLRELYCCYCPFLIYLPDDLPNSIELINLTGNANLIIPNISPCSLKIFVCVMCHSIEKILYFPESIEELVIGYCELLIELPKFPSQLKNLKIYNTPFLKSIPEFPELLEKLYIGNLDSITEIPTFPKNLTYFTCMCENITNLPILPSFIRNLDISYSGILELPDLPECIQSLNISNCKSLMRIGKIPDTIQLICVDSKLVSDKKFRKEVLNFIKSIHAKEKIIWDGIYSGNLDTSFRNNSLLRFLCHDVMYTIEKYYIDIYLEKYSKQIYKLVEMDVKSFKNIMENFHLLKD